MQYPVQHNSSRYVSCCAADVMLKHNLQDSTVHNRISLHCRGGFPEADDAAIRIGEESERTHSGHHLLLDHDLSAGVLYALAILRQVVHADVEGHVAGPRILARGSHDSAVDAPLPAGLDHVIVRLRRRLDLPVEGLAV